MAQAVTLPLRTAWIADFVKRGKQRTKWHQSNLHLTRMSLQQSRHRTVQLPTSGGRLRPVPQNCMTLDYNLTAHIRCRGEESKTSSEQSNYKPRRWVVERV